MDTIHKYYLSWTQVVTIVHNGLSGGQMSGELLSVPHGTIIDCLSVKCLSVLCMYHIGQTYMYCQAHMGPTYMYCRVHMGPTYMY